MPLPFFCAEGTADHEESSPSATDPQVRGWDTRARRALVILYPSLDEGHVSKLAERRER